MLTGKGFLAGVNEFELFDSINYISGLSGGSWLLMDLIIHDFEITESLEDWNLDEELLKCLPELDLSDQDLISIEESALPLVKRTNKTPNVFQAFYRNMEWHTIIKEKWAPHKDASKLLRRGMASINNIKQILFSNSTTLGQHKLDRFRDCLDFYVDLHLKTRKKKMDGFPLSFTDYWSKALINRINSTFLQGLKTLSFSSLTKNTKKFKNHEAPVPLVIANCKNSNLQNVIFEFTPFEFGSWNKMLRSFIDEEYLGSFITAGEAQKCYKGLDDISFVTATSSSIFNNALIYIWNLISRSSKEFISAFKMVMSLFGLGTIDDNLLQSEMKGIQLGTDYAVFQPNPFFKLFPEDNELTQTNYLYLVDGGEDGENLPIRSLVIPERKIDLLIVIDSSSDTQNYPDGSRLIKSFEELEKDGIYYERNQVLLDKPSLYGCNMDVSMDYLPPLILYYANTNYVFESNFSTLKTTYEQDEILQMIANGKSIFQQTSSSDYRSCLGCFIAKRPTDKKNLTSQLPVFCQSCFSEYCAS